MPAGFRLCERTFPPSFPRLFFLNADRFRDESNRFAAEEFNASNGRKLRQQRQSKNLRSRPLCSLVAFVQVVPSCRRDGGEQSSLRLLSTHPASGKVECPLCFALC